MALFSLLSFCTGDTESWMFVTGLSAAALSCPESNGPAVAVAKGHWPQEPTPPMCHRVAGKPLFLDIKGLSWRNRRGQLPSDSCCKLAGGRDGAVFCHRELLWWHLG